MRPIKFRIWDKINSEWSRTAHLSPIYGLEIFSQHDNGIIPLQFTGLLDKNGREIYEGDIILSDYYSVARDKYEKNKDVVVFQNGCFIAKYYKLWQNEQNGGAMILDRRDIEVIGNIFENRDLIIN